MRKIIIIVAVFSAILFAFDFSADTLISSGFQELLDSIPPQEKFPDASYYVVTDSMVIKMLPDGGYEKEVYQLMKAYSYRGKKQLSNYKISYNADFEEIELIRGRTINPEGVFPVDSTEVNEITTPGYSDAMVYAKLSQMVVSLPAFAESSVSEIHYKVRTKIKPPVPFGGMHVLVGEEPARKIFFAVTSPQGKKINYLSVSGAPEPEVSGQQVAWTIEDYPGMQYEPDIPTLREICPTALYATSRNWRDEAENIAGMLLPRAVPNEMITSLAESLAQDKSSEEAVEAILFYLQEKFNRIHVSPNLIGYRPNDAGQVFDNGYGDSRDLAILLSAMLRSVDIPNSPVLVSSSGANIWDLPTVHQFDRVVVIAEIDGKEIYLDPMQQYSPTGFLGSANGEKAFSIKPGESGLKQIPPFTPDDNRVTFFYNLILEEDGSISGTVITETNGDAAGTLRSMFRHAKKSKKKQKFQKAASNIADGAKIEGETKLEGIEKNSGIALAELSFSADNFLTIQDRMAILWLPKSPFSLVDLPDISKDEREFPIFNSLPMKYEKRFNISFPEKYKLVYVPPTTHIENEVGSMDIDSQMGEHSMQIRVVLNLKMKRINPEEYNKLQTLIRNMTAKRFRIVLLENMFE